jgi:hypothetical protein
MPSTLAVLGFAISETGFSDQFCTEATLTPSPVDVRFTPESGHRNRPAYYLRRTNSGSLAILAAIRRASSFVSSLGR